MLDRDWNHGFPPCPECGQNAMMPIDEVETVFISEKCDNRVERPRCCDLRKEVGNPAVAVAALTLALGLSHGNRHCPLRTSSSRATDALNGGESADTTERPNQQA